MAFKSSSLARQPYKEIKKMVLSYHSTMREISGQLTRQPTGPQISLNDEPIGFYITPEELTGIQNTIAKLDGFRQYLVLFGIEAEINKQNLTVCIVGADENGEILKKYKTDESTYGEEKWPNKVKLTLGNNTQNITDFLNKV
jgi:hypothetical protein